MKVRLFEKKIKKQLRTNNKKGMDAQIKTKECKMSVTQVNTNRRQTGLWFLTNINDKMACVS
jgi:hypothetical protein